MSGKTHHGMTLFEMALIAGIVVVAVGVIAILLAD